MWNYNDVCLTVNDNKNCYTVGISKNIKNNINNNSWPSQQYYTHKLYCNVIKQLNYI